MQAKRQSLLETIFSTAVGFIVTLLTYEFVVNPIWNLTTSFHENLGITGVFTIVSVARGYLIRRFFNWLNNKNNNEANFLGRNHR